MNLKRVQIFLLPILGLLAAPLMRADLFTSLNVYTGAPQYQYPPYGDFGINLSCGANGTTIASCSQAGIATFDGVSVPTTISGTAEAEYGVLSIMSQMGSSLPGDVYPFNLNVGEQATASFGEGVIVHAPGYTNGFLQFNVSGFYDNNGLCIVITCAAVTALFSNGTSQLELPIDLGGSFGSQVDLPVEFGVPFSLSISLEMDGTSETESGQNVISDSAELDFSQPVVLDASGNPIPGATITPEASSWLLLLTAALFIAPAIRQRFNARP
jgi:hypothetical protein